MSVGPFAVVPQDVSVYSRHQPVKPEPQTGSRSPSIHSNGVAVPVDSNHSMAHNGLPLSTEDIVKDEQLIIQWDEPVSPESPWNHHPSFPKSMVSWSVRIHLTSHKCRSSRSDETTSVPTYPSAFQPASVARKRKQRNSSIVNIDQIQNLHLYRLSKKTD